MASCSANCILLEGPYEDKPQRINEMSMIMVPASTTKARTFSHTVRPTLRNTGVRYWGSSSMRKLRSLLFNSVLSVQPANNAATKPSR